MFLRTPRNAKGIDHSVHTHIGIRGKTVSINPEVPTGVTRQILTVMGGITTGDHRAPTGSQHKKRQPRIDYHF
ncbi:MAG: hypothetical protein LBG24_09885 [Treponema sp.]|nr:hypothetical protein [Treponema sp.]